MKLIILDRDGVINEDSDAYIKHPDEWHALPGSLEAITRLHQAGWTIAIASSQSGLARGFFDITALTDIHQKFRKALAIRGSTCNRGLSARSTSLGYCRLRALACADGQRSTDRNRRRLTCRYVRGQRSGQRSGPDSVRDPLNDPCDSRYRFHAIFNRHGYSLRLCLHALVATILELALQTHNGLA